MSDKRLREAELEYKKTGTQLAQSRLLLERVKSGLIDIDRLRLAALYGHPAARSMFGDQEPNLPDNFQDWRHLFRQWEVEVLVRTAVASATHVISIYEQSFPGDNRPRRALISAINWIQCQSEQNEYAARAAYDAARDAAIFANNVGADVPKAAAEAATLTASCASYASSVVLAMIHASFVVRNTSIAIEANEGNVHRGDNTIWLAPFAVRGQYMRNIISSHFIEFALGPVDPLIALRAELEAGSE